VSLQQKQTTKTTTTTTTTKPRNENLEEAVASVATMVVRLWSSHTYSDTGPPFSSSYL
jgi:hypothetical protein